MDGPTAGPASTAAPKPKKKFIFQVIGALVILSLFLAGAYALAVVSKNTDGVLAAVNDTRADLEKKIKDVEGKIKTFATLSDLNALAARFDEHAKEDKKARGANRKDQKGHSSPSRRKEPDALDRAMGKNVASNNAQPVIQPATAFPDPRQCAGKWVSAGKNEWVCQSATQSAEAQTSAPAPAPTHTAPEQRADNASFAADVCAPLPIEQNGHGGWRCANTTTRQPEQTFPQGGVVYASPQQRFYGVNDKGSSYSWSQAATAGGLGCVVGALIDHGAGCARALVGAVAGDFVDQKVLENDSHIGAIIGGGIGAGASWQYRRPATIAQGFTVGGPVVGGPIPGAP